MYYLILFFILGLFAGSFFYTLALRYINKSIETNPFKALFSRSHCPHCNSVINPILLIPIFGFIISKASCKYCGIRISFLYPFYEILFGFVYFLVVSKLGVTLYSVNIIFLISIGLTIAIIDLKIFEVPNSLVIVFTLSSLYPVIYDGKYLQNLYGLLFMFLFFFVILFLFPGSFGGGDVKIASAMGLVAGFQLSIVILETAVITGAIVGVIFAIKTKKGLKSKIPFAPFLTLGFLVAYVYGHDILLLYFNTLF